MSERLSMEEYIEELKALELRMMELCKASGFRAPMQDLEIIYAIETILEDEGLRGLYGEDKWSMFALLAGECGYQPHDHVDAGFVEDMRSDVLQAMLDLDLVKVVMS